MKSQFEPHYQHDCDMCQFLGHYKGADLYYCRMDVLEETVVARRSSDGPDYISGMEFTGVSDLLGMALRRAMELGLIERREEDTTLQGWGKTPIEALRELADRLEELE